MPRPRKPWFRKATGWWMVEIDGRQLRLANGREGKALGASAAASPVAWLSLQRSLHVTAITRTPVPL